MQKTLSIIGGGKVGRTLGRLWASAQAVDLLDVLNRSSPSASSAVTFIGAGRAIVSYADLRQADIYMIATPDDRIAESCAALAANGKISTSSVVFHCSGALSANVLHDASRCGAAIASIHPIRSFASPANLVQEFAGTWCGMEGDQRAIDAVTPCFEAIGARLVAIDGNMKIYYHAAAVFASNYLVTLLDVAQHAYMEAGVAPEAALELMKPLVRETVENVFRLGPPKALTGPVARGDIETVEKQQEAVTRWQQAYGDLYRDFAALTAELAARRTEKA